jgi:hypothetical protein
MTKKFTLALVPLLALLSASCGKLESKRKSKETLKEDEPKLSEMAFKEQCSAAGGVRRGRNNQLCWVPAGPAAALPPFEALNGATKVRILENFHAGMYIVFNGKINNRVEILYDGATLMAGEGHHLADSGDGKELAFFVKGSGYENVTAMVWKCFNRNMGPVFCNREDMKP